MMLTDDAKAYIKRITFILKEVIIDSKLSKLEYKDFMDEVENEVANIRDDVEGGQFDEAS